MGYKFEMSMKHEKTKANSIKLNIITLEIAINFDLSFFIHECTILK